MELEGKIWKSKQHWLVEVPSLDVMTQGKTRDEALSMIQDAIAELIYSYFPNQVRKGFEVTISDYKKGVVGVSLTDGKLLLSLILKRQREKSQTSVREAASRLGSESPNAYAQYEKGKINISLDKFEELLHAANPQHHSLLRVI
jgi:hypothetical protein